jgi:AraC-like DNA-binding protein
MCLDLDYQPLQGRAEGDNSYQFLLPKRPLGHWVQSLWQLNVPAGSYQYRSMPDNCIDWIINLDNPTESFVVTPFSSSIIFDIHGPVSYFGIRFSILGHHGIISDPVGAWGMDDDTDAADIIPAPILNSLQDGLDAQVDFESRCQFVSKQLLASLHFYKVDPRLARYVRYSYANTSSNIDLSDKQCGEFGLSSRQLRRLSNLYLGLSPREFHRVLRLQKTIKAVTAADDGSWMNHYYDQPHFAREFKSLSGLTPSQFKRLSVLYNT